MLSEHANRRYLYLHVARLEDMAGRLLSGEGSVIARDLTVGPAGSGYQKAPPDPQSVFYKHLADVEKRLIADKKVGTIDAPKEYFHGWLTVVVLQFDEVRPPVLYLTGQTEDTVVALTGHLVNRFGFPEQYATSSPDAPIITSEREVAALIHEAQMRTIEDGEATAQGAKLARARDRYSRWESDVVNALAKMEVYRPRAEQPHVEVLAYKDSFASAHNLNGVLTQPRNVLIGKPLWVAQRG
jgi:hypothetical protein